MGRYYQHIALILMFSFVSSMLMALDGSGKWRLAKSKNGIRVFTKKSESSLLDDSKATVTINMPLERVYQFITNIERQHEWMDRVKTSKILKKTSERDFITYYEAVAPWPIANRDIVSHYTIHTDEQGKVIIRINGEPDFIPRKENLVRIQNVVSTWEIIPLSENSVEVVYISHTDPGGNVPEWLVNATVTDNPYNTLKNLRDLLEVK